MVRIARNSVFVSLSPKSNENNGHTNHYYNVSNEHSSEHIRDRDYIQKNLNRQTKEHTIQSIYEMSE